MNPRPQNQIRERTVAILAAFDGGEKRLDVLVERFGGHEASILWLLKRYGRKGWKMPPRASSAATEEGRRRGQHQFQQRFKLPGARRRLVSGATCAGVDPDFEGS